MLLKLKRELSKIDIMTPKDFLLMNLGVLLMSTGIYFFKFPNNFTMGGVSGISVILGALTEKATPATLVFAINMILLAVGFCVFGKSFGFKTAYASIMMSAELWLLEAFLPMKAAFTSQPLLELVFATMLPAIGSAILFNLSASSGGTDVIAMILKKYTNVNIGNALLLSDTLIVLWSFFVFGMETGLFSLLGLASKALVVDNVIESINLCKYFTIITTKPEEVCDYIKGTLIRGATKISARGAFKDEDRVVIMTVVKRFEGAILQKQVKEIDPHAFIMITNTSEIIGKGFRGV